MIYFIILANVLRFFGLDISPPGFYADESYGATQVICIAQTGADFFGSKFPLFSISGPGEPIYTPAYLYGQLLWTSIFGYSISAFRAYPAFVTALTIAALYLYAKNISNKKVALYIAFCASALPWAFQFSRIAWDPPLAPLFLIAGLWMTNFKRLWWFAGIPFALSIYSYPPLRIIAPLILFFLPNLAAKKKIIVFGIIACCCIPLAYAFQKENFFSRSNMLSIWSEAYYNPYRHYSAIELIQVFLRNWFAHLSPSFLFNRGDVNLRHSIQSFGMLSWLDIFAILASPYLLIKYLRQVNSTFDPPQKKLIVISLLGIGISLIPAALTNEAPPHALRTITAWPFYAIFTGTILYQLEQIIVHKKIFYTSIVAIGFVFFTLYLNSYFFKYPFIAKEGFEAGYSNDILYPRLANNEIKCDDLRTSTKKMDRNVRVGEPIIFSQNGSGPITSYLNKHWYDRENWGIWSDGKNADLLIPMPHGNPKKIVFYFNALITPSHREQKIEIWINNDPIETYFISNSTNNKIEVPIPSKVDPDKLLNIEFRTPNAISPIDANISSSDKRTLGIGLISLEFQD